MNYYQTPKRKVFISFSQRDRTEVDAFIDKWATRQGVFTPKVLGVSSNDDFINSTNPEYVMSQIRAKYLQDSTVTIVLIGKCTHSRRYVDWEIKASLRQGEDDLPNGLLGILLPSAGDRAHLPPRFADNWKSGEAECYARYRAAPATADTLRAWIEDSYEARSARADLITNTQDMMKNNAQCKVCGVTH
ncbi:MAG: TIR domain-containing protein [Kiritimatiellae bacterium]|nr:TIR domain-containing protein [Kiritimatiellia bacterium]